MFDQQSRLVCEAVKEAMSVLEQDTLIHKQYNQEIIALLQKNGLDLIPGEVVEISEELLNTILDMGDEMSRKVNKLHKKLNTLASVANFERMQSLN